MIELSFAQVVIGGVFLVVLVVLAFLLGIVYRDERR